MVNNKKFLILWTLMLFLMYKGASAQFIPFAFLKNRAIISTSSSSISPFLVAAGRTWSCAIASEGGAKCWGANGSGQLGNGTTNSTTTPVPVSNLSGAIAIAASGNNFTCALITGGTVKCWGGNTAGQFGNGNTNSQTTPITVSGISGATGVLAGYSHVCALIGDGTVKCLGANDTGQLGDGTNTLRTTPVLVSGLSTVIAISGGPAFNCALLSSGQVNCWGSGQFGALGIGTGGSSNTPVPVSGISNAIAIATGSYHACAVLSDGTVKCWGYNSSGQLGNGNTINSFDPVTVSGLTGAKAITAGEEHSCAIVDTGAVKCWGSGGTLGNGGSSNSSTPVDVSGISTAIDISAKFYHTCAVLSGGGAKCWGLNNNGQLGNGTDTNQSTPATVSGLSVATMRGNFLYDPQNLIQTYIVPVGVTAVTVKAWGAGGAGGWNDTVYSKAGTGGAGGYATHTFTVTPGETITVHVGGGGQPATSYSSPAASGGYGGGGNGGGSGGGAGGGGSFVFYRGSLMVAAAGGGGGGMGQANNSESYYFGGMGGGGGQAGTKPSSGTNDIASPGTTQGGIGGLAGASSDPNNPINGACTDGASSFGVGGAGASFGGGGGGGGLCGGGGAPGHNGGSGGAGGSSYGTSFENAPSPDAAIATPSPANASDPDRTSAFSTAGNGGTARSFVVGAGTSGQAGLVVIKPISSNPTGVNAIAAGNFHTCALKSGGLKCWGYNAFGQVGDGTTGNNRTSATQVRGFTAGVTSVGLGQMHSCAIINGAAKCWGGYHAQGSLGDGLTSPSEVPNSVATPAVQVVGLTNGSGVKDLNPGVSASASCAIVRGGAKCWGQGNRGMLGNGVTANQLSPVDVSGLTNNAGVSKITMGVWQTCAIVKTGAMCWGQNDSGQLGNGSAGADQLTPLAVSSIPRGASDIASGALHVCAIVSGGVWCWGNNAKGQLGLGNTTNRSVPTSVTALTSGVTRIAAGAEFTCAIKSGAVYCWGSNDRGQIGNNNTNGVSVTTPFLTPITSGATDLAIGAQHVCATVNGGVQCWGRNDFGAVGDGTTGNKYVPTSVLDL